MDVELAVSGGVATLTLNRPDSLNALTPQMLELLVQHLDRVESDPQIRALLFTGAGRPSAPAPISRDQAPPRPR